MYKRQAWGSVIKRGLIDELSYYGKIYEEAVEYFTAGDSILEQKFAPAFVCDKDFISGMISAVDKLSLIHILSVRGVKIGIVIKQDIEPKSYKISVRTNDEYAANEICAFFGGGGHLRAAGARVHANCVEKAVQRTLRAVSRKTDMIIEA